MKMLRYQGRKNTDEASRMKCKRCKTQDVAYQDEKRRMQQIGATTFAMTKKKVKKGHIKKGGGSINIELGVKGK